MRLEYYGVRENRRFHIVDEGGRLVNAKTLGRLLQVAADYDDAAGTLELRFPDGSVAGGRIELGEPLDTVFFGGTVAGRVVVGPWADDLSRLAGRPLRLVQADRPGDAVDRGRRAAVTLV